MISGKKLAGTIIDGFDNRFSKEKFVIEISRENIAKDKQVTYLPLPESKPDNSSVELDLFDIAPAVNVSRAMA